MNQPNPAPSNFEKIDWERYVNQLSLAIALPIPPECKPEVIANLHRTAAIAQLVLEFPLNPPPTIAPIFQP